MKKKSLIIVVFSLFFIAMIKAYSQKKECYPDSIFTIHQDEMFLNFDSTQKRRIILSDTKELNNFYTVLESGAFNIKYYKQKEIEKWLFYTIGGKLEHVKYVYAYNTNVNLFKEYFFDDNGNITKTVDYEKGFSICWEEAIEICKKQIGEKKLKRLNIKNFYLYRVDGSNPYNHPGVKPLWIVWPLTNKGNNHEDRYLKGKNNGKLSYCVDGVSGELIKKLPESLEYIYITME